MGDRVEKLRRVALRQVWPREAADFTTWLGDNLDVLSDVVGVTLGNADTEQPAGTLSVDIVAEDDNGNAVVIENQLEKSDHDHLGKLITYLSVRGAKRAIWVVADPRPEHVSAIQWLNQSALAEFYLIKVEAVQIGSSPPAPLFTQIASPAEEIRRVGEAREEEALRHTERRQFWDGLLATARDHLKSFANISSGPNSYIQAGAGKSGISFGFAVRQHDLEAYLYIDLGKDAEEENKRLFDQLAAARAEIEGAFGDSLDWQRLDGKRGCRIRKSVSDGGYRDPEMWLDIFPKAVLVMDKLERALRPHIQKFRTADHG